MARTLTRQYSTPSSSSSKRAMMVPSSPSKQWRQGFNPLLKVHLPIISGRRTRLFSLRTLLSLMSCIGSLLVLWWLTSSRRQEEIMVRRISCTPSLPWYYFFRDGVDGGGQPYYEGETFIQGTRRKWTSGVTPTNVVGNDDVDDEQQQQPQVISILQICPGAKKWWMLDYLVRNHKEYARRWGYEYRLRTDGQSGVWDKIYMLRDTIARELDEIDKAAAAVEAAKLTAAAATRADTNAKEVDGHDEMKRSSRDTKSTAAAAKKRRTSSSWIFYTDIDTLIVNREIPLDALLPPENIEQPFLLMADDHRGLNAGSILIRVDDRSLDFLDAVSSVRSSAEQKRLSLQFAEQSAIAMVVQDKRLKERGHMVTLPSDWINSYGGEAAFHRKSGPVLTLHFPSVGFKRRSMLPLLSKLIYGTVKMDMTQQRHKARMMEVEANEFWEAHGSRSPGS